MPIRILFAIATAAALTGCQTIGDATGMGRTERVQIPPPGELAEPVVAPRGPAATNALAGMGAERLLSLWGEPSRKRKDIGSELWQYGKGKCSVLVYMYPLAGGPLTVSHAEAVPGGMEDAIVASCAKGNGLPPLKPVS